VKVSSQRFDFVAGGFYFEESGIGHLSLSV
jgi:hypothetical protein